MFLYLEKNKNHVFLLQVVNLTEIFRYIILDLRKNQSIFFERQSLYQTTNLQIPDISFKFNIS